VPSEYKAGDTLDIALALEMFGQLRWGFEITVLDGDNDYAGDLIVTDPVNTQKNPDAVTGREYMKHTLTGTHNGTPDASPGWSLRWAAPQAEGTGPVTFYMAGNAANGNFSNSGDYIYTTLEIVGEDLSSDVDEGDLPLPMAYELVQNRPNPFNPSTSISFSLRKASYVQLVVYNGLGQEVTRLVDGYRTAGVHNYTWNGTDSGGEKVPSGVYFCRLVTPEFVDARKMVLAK
jgi:hypothetical protein